MTEHHRIDLADADTLASFYREQTSTETRFVQVSAGPAILDARSLDLGRMRLLRVSADGSHLWEDRMGPGEWRFALLSESAGAARCGGAELSPALGSLLRPGGQLDLLTDGVYRTLEVTFDAALAAELAWRCSPATTARVPENAAHALESTVDAALAVFSRARPTASDDWLRVHRWRWSELILDQLELVLQPWLDGARAPDRPRTRVASGSLVRRVRERLDDLDYAKSAKVETLARDLGVSRRSLFLAFRTELGVGPRRFNELIRLNLLRARLYRGGPDRTTITAEANELGFFELGRMATNYRRLFGESPRDTLGRPA